MYMNMCSYVNVYVYVYVYIYVYVYVCTCICQYMVVCMYMIFLLSFYHGSILSNKCESMDDGHRFNNDFMIDSRYYRSKRKNPLLMDRYYRWSAWSIVSIDTIRMVSIHRSIADYSSYAKNVLKIFAKSTGTAVKRLKMCCNNWDHFKLKALSNMRHLKLRW